jgi:tetratricopeptide (TPR) repeat protein
MWPAPRGESSAKFAHDCPSNAGMARQMQPGANGVSSIEHALNGARALHQSGRLDEAKDLYRSVLERDPRQVDALLLLSVLEHQCGNDENALELVTRALDENPDSVEALVHRAMTLRSLGRPEKALESYDAALAIRPDIADVLYNRGNVLQSLGRHSDALTSYDAALALQPGDAAALNNRAVVLQALGRFDAALQSCNRALSIQPGYAEALNNRGNVLQGLGRHQDALQSYDAALARKARYAEALNNRGNALQALGRFEEALNSYDSALAIDSKHVDALSSRGTALYHRGRYTEALTSYETAFTVTPSALRAVNVGNALQALGDYGRALTLYDRALELNPDSVEALNNRGNALRALNRHEEALASYIKATEIAPEDAHAHWNEGLVRLLMGDYERGWQKYEWRWRNRQLNASPRLSDEPQWHGDEAIAGKTVLVHAEQGFGDAIQFIRYVPLLAARGASVAVACHESLRDLFSQINGVREVVTSADALPRFDYHVPLISLPYAFKTTLGDIPAHVPYLNVRAQDIEPWKAKLAVRPGFKVGLAWMGNPKFTAAGAKSCSLEQLQLLLDQPACTFISLQKGDAAAGIRALGLTGHIADHTGELHSFSDTAALITNLDLVISIDTAVAHLAGALGKPVWILLPFAADWRWLRHRQDSPWYPSARLFRQPRLGDWDSVLHEIHDALAELAR